MGAWFFKNYKKIIHFQPLKLLKCDLGPTCVKPQIKNKVCVVYGMFKNYSILFYLGLS